MPLSFSSALSAVAISNLDKIDNFIWFNWAIVYVVTVFTMALALTPTTVIAILSGYFLGFAAIIPVVISYSLASIGGFLLSKPLGGNFQSIIRSSYPRVDAFIHRMSDKSPISFVIFSRVSPILPFAVMNLVLPFIGVKFKPYFWGGILGMLPRTILAITAGKLAKDIFTVVENPSSGLIMQIGFGVLFIISFAGFLFLFKKKDA